MHGAHSAGRDAAPYWDYCRAPGVGGGFKRLEAANFGPARGSPVRADTTQGNPREGYPGRAPRSPRPGRLLASGGAGGDDFSQLPHLHHLIASIVARARHHLLHPRQEHPRCRSRPKSGGRSALRRSTRLGQAPANLIRGKLQLGPSASIRHPCVNRLIYRLAWPLVPEDRSGACGATAAMIRLLAIRRD